jgi:predicted alpha/beta-hydrolase family hydrolase
MRWWHEAVETADWGLVLTHGAGSNAEAPLLKALGDGFAAQGMVVMRYDLPYREARPHGPPFPAQAAADREGIRAAVSEMRSRARRVIAAGHSYGGRQSSMAAAEDSRMVEALLLLSYPLHPPRKPEQMRTTHFSELRTPAFFVHGSRDPFGSVLEMEAALSMIPARTELMIVEGAPHGLSVGAVPRIVQRFCAFLREERGIHADTRG